MFMLVGVNKQMEELTLILCKQALHQKGNHPGVLWECKVLMSQMSQWVMSHESWVMSQGVRSEKKKFCRNNKIKRYIYLFCLVVLLLPAQGSYLPIRSALIETFITRWIQINF